VIPEVTSCPLCRKETLEIYPDPLSSRWLRCPQCDFSGDTIELYGKIHNISDDQLSIRDIFAKRLASIPFEEIPPQTMESYLTGNHKQRQHIKTIWNALSGQRPHMHPLLLRRVQDEHLWCGWHSAGYDRIRRVLGVGTRHQIHDLLGNNKLLPKRGFEANLVINFQDAPGRICSLSFIGDKSEEITKNFNKDGEGGLGMLDGISPYEDTVYAVHNHHMALRFHGQWFMDFADPLKMVLFNRDTNRAWRNVFAKKVIFWDEQPDLDLFEHARKVGPGPGYVALRPCYGGEFQEQPTNYVKSITHVLPTVDKNSYPWPEAFVRWMVEFKEFNEAKFQANVAKLNLDKAEREAIIDASPSKYKKRITELFKGIRAIRSAVVNGKEVSENDKGWWVVSKKSPELISGAAIRVIKEIKDECTGKIYWNGEIRCEGKEVQFMDPVEVINDDPIGWLSKKVVDAGCSYPIIKPNWAKFLSCIAQQFSIPEKVSEDSTLGINALGKIKFPHLTLDARVGCVTKDMPVIDPEMPAQCVTMPCQYIPRDVSDSKVRPVWGALVSMFASDFICKVRSRPNRGCLIPGPQGSILRRAMSNLAKVMGITRYEIKKGDSKEIERIREKLGSFNYPGFVEPLFDGLLANYPAKGDRAFIAGSHLEIAALMVSRADWMVIESVDMISPNYQFPGHSDILLFLLKLMRTSFQVDPALPLPLATAKVWASWYDGEKGMVEGGRFEEIRKIFKEPPPAGDAMIELCGLLYRERQPRIIDRDHTSFVKNLKSNGNVYSGGTCILIDDVEGKVFIDKSVLQKAVVKEKLPPIDCAAVTDSFLARGLLRFQDMAVDGWIIDRSHWGKVLNALDKRMPRYSAVAESGGA